MSLIKDNDWLQMVLELKEKLDNVKFDCIIGIPRSGLAVASYLSTMTAKPLSVPEKFLNNKDHWTMGKSLQVLQHMYPNEFKHEPVIDIKIVLLVEDDTGSGIGNSKMMETKKSLQEKFPDLKILTAALITTKHSKDNIDYFVRTYDHILWDNKLKSVGIGVKKIAIIILTSSMASDEFHKCYWHLVQNTHLEYQIFVIESHIKEYRYGYARDVNVIIKGVEADYYILLNDDVYVQEYWLEALIKTTFQDKDIGIVGALLLFPDGRIQHAGGKFVMRKGEKRVDHKWFNEDLNNVSSAYKQTDCIFVTGALTLITRECLNKIGIMDERYKISYMDVEYCFRAWKHNIRVVYQPNCRAVHEGSKTITDKYAKKNIDWHNEYWRILVRDYGSLFDGIVWNVEDHNKRIYPLPVVKTNTPWTLNRIYHGGIRRTKRYAKKVIKKVLL